MKADYLKSRTLGRAAAAALLAIGMSGCSTVMSEMQQGGRNLVTGVAGAPDRPVINYAVPDDGTRIDAGSPAALVKSLKSMLDPLPADQQKYLASAFFTTAKIRSCQETGYPEAFRKAQYGYPKQMRRSCSQNKNLNTYMWHSMDHATELVTSGRMDSDKLRASQMTLYGAPIGGVSVRGSSQRVSVAYFTQFSGPYVDGMTRTDVTNFFHDALESSKTGLPKDLKKIVS